MRSEIIAGTIVDPSFRTNPRSVEVACEVLASSRTPRMRTEAHRLTTPSHGAIIDITDMVIETVRRAGVRHGQTTVMTLHTTTALLINERERGFWKDLRRLLDRVIPADAYYEHDDLTRRTENLQTDEPVNGHSHCRQACVGSATTTIPVVDSALLLGQWQRILFLELDRARERKFVVHVQGA